jgi:hypothetical protein
VGGGDVYLFSSESILTEKKNGIRSMTSAKSRNSCRAPLALEILSLAYECVCPLLYFTVTSTIFSGKFNKSEY